MNWEHDYLDLLGYVAKEGDERQDRTGVGTRSMFGHDLLIDLRNGFPAVTSKSLGMRAVTSELLWFIEGSGDERRLAEILHGTRDLSKRTIWSDNADETTGAKYKPTYYGDLGRVYGVQWRSWKTFVEAGGDKLDGGLWAPGEPVDQLNNLINSLKNDPHGRRHIISAWNPGELDQMALPPCHMMAQFYVNSKNELSCQMYQRSADLFLGVPFNIASYALFTHMIAQVCGLKVGGLKLVFGDVHVYKNHLDQVQEQLTREIHAAPTLKLNPDIKDIDKFTMTDIELVGYTNSGVIKAPMAK